MRTPFLLLSDVFVAVLLVAPQHGRADVTAEAELVLTITLNDILLINPDETGVSAFDEFAIEVSDFGVGTQFFGGGSPSNPTGAVGSDSASESVFFAGVDANDENFSAFDTGLAPGDTFVLTQRVEAVASTPGSTFFSQIDSEVSLVVDSFGFDDQRFLFDFDIGAELTGELDLSTTPGSALVIAEGREIVAFADSTVTGAPNEFTLFAGENDRYYDLATFASASSVVPVNDTGGPINVPVEFSPGDNFFTVTFRSSLLVNAVTDEADPPSGVTGDYNNDGVVDAADYTVWRDNVGAPADTLVNDPSGVATGQAQYDAWTANFGATAPASSTAVPEPCSGLIALGAAVAAARRW